MGSSTGRSLEQEKRIFTSSNHPFPTQLIHYQLCKLFDLCIKLLSGVEVERQS